MRQPPSHPRVRADHDHAPGHPRDRLLAAAFRPARLTHACCLAACLLAATAAAQTPASTDAAQDRSQKQSDSVYRWIKIHSEPARKSEAIPKPRPKAEAAQQAARKPDAPSSPSEPAPIADTRLDAPTTAAVSAPAPEAASASAPVPAATTAPAPAVAEAEDMDLRPISQPQPEIPRELRTSIATGRVMLSFTVETNGSVTDAAVVRTTNRRLSKPVLEAVSQWRFEPIRTARAVQVEIEFNLQ